MSQERIENDRIEPGKAIDVEKTRVQPDGRLFQQYMEEGGGPAKTTAPTPVQQPPTPGLTTGPSYDKLLTQVNSAQGNLQMMQNHLNDNPNLKFKRQQQYLLRDKLTSANQHLASANSKLGGQPPEPKQVSDQASPIEKFIGYVADGQNQLIAAKKQIEALKDQGPNLNPSELLLVQVKLSQAQQEIEYSSTLLSKVVDTFKQMMSIQL